MNVRREKDGGKEAWTLPEVGPVLRRACNENLRAEVVKQRVGEHRIVRVCFEACAGKRTAEDAIKEPEPSIGKASSVKSQAVELVQNRGERKSSQTGRSLYYYDRF